MSRATLLDWRIGALSLEAPFLERKFASLSMVDRWLSTAEGWVALKLDAFDRLRFARFARLTSVHGKELTTATDDQLRERAAKLRSELQREGMTPDCTAQTFALCREASFRMLGKRHYDVQVMGGYGLLRGRLIEMATGEGKTLTAVLPAFTLALAGIPVHVVTVNDYLARRDAGYVQPVLSFFGISVGVVTDEESPDQKRIAYAADVVYCVNKDVVFDYLRDGLAGDSVPTGSARSLRGLYFALVDEADSVLIDEARTPLVIARERPDVTQTESAKLALRIAASLQERLHFDVERDGRRYVLTEGGRARVEELFDVQFALDTELASSWHISKVRAEKIEQALLALHDFKNGQHYVIRDEKIQIVDEFTGRILPDRSWERGLHQMIEVKENLSVTAPRETIARQTYPGFFSRYLRVSGMSGTAVEVAGEMKARFGMRTVRIPNNRLCVRKFRGARLFSNSAQRWRAVAERACELANSGRAVLIGTRSVAASQELSAMLTSLNQPHETLNALQNEREAEIIGRAGRAGQVTVATNMAGRGTDIELEPSVRAAGGLHVILSEFHESRRIDRQLYGRAGRQGDPGSCEAIVSVQDELFTKFAPLATKVVGKLGLRNGELAAAWAPILRFIAQFHAERTNARIRSNAADHDSALKRVLAFAGAEK